MSFTAPGIPGGSDNYAANGCKCGPLAGGAPDALGDRDQLGRRLRRSMFGAGHPRDGLLHQGAAQVIGPAVSITCVRVTPSLTQLV